MTYGTLAMAATVCCHYDVKKTSQRRFDVIRTLLLYHVSAGKG